MAGDMKSGKPGSSAAYPETEHAPTNTVAVDYAIIIISHGALAVELKKALEHLMGPQPLVAALDIPADEPLRRTRQRLQVLLDGLPAPEQGGTHGRPLVFLSDLFGGTPANLALAELRGQHDSWLITGVNLPVLVRLAELRGQVDPARAVEEAAAVGRRLIRTQQGSNAA